MKKYMSNKISYLSVLALLAVVATGLFLMTDSTSVSAQKGDISSRGESDGKGRDAREVTPGMLALALNFGFASEYAVFADKGVSTGNSRIQGKVAAPSDSASGSKAQTDLLNAFNVMENLPCLQSRGETREGNLRNGSFTPGVYCANTGNLTGSYVLDGNGDPNAVFIFRSKGSIRAESDFNISFANGADASNVYFVAGTTANIAEGVNFSGSILARDTISVGQGSTVKGRIMSVEGNVKMQEASAMLQDGVLQICKTAFGAGLEDRIFRFQIGSQIILVPVGSCSGPITLPAGNTTITELIDGPTIPSGTFSGRFRLIDVGTDPADALVSANLVTRTVVVNVRAGNIQNQTVVEFVNVFAVNAIIEICKYPAQDQNPTGTGVVPRSDTTGAQGDANIRDRDVLPGTPFEFTINVLENTVITVPVGGCSPAIQLNVPTAPAAVPAGGEVFITELAILDSFGNPVYRLDGDPGSLAASTFPANRLNTIDFNVGLDNGNFFGFPPFFNPGGGVVGVDILEGGVANQTTVNFWNRSEPGYVKICKVAGFGIPVGTLFAFDVYGREPSNTARTEFDAQAPPTAGDDYPATIPFPGAILPGVDTVRRVTVPAGPGPLGFCEFVRFNSPAASGGRVQYIVGSQVLVQELGANAVTGTPGNTAPNVFPVTAANNDPRVASVTPIPQNNVPFTVPAGSIGGVPCSTAPAPAPPGGVSIATCPAVQTDPPTGIRVGSIRLNAGAAPSFPASASIVNTNIAANAICTTTLGNSANNGAGGATLNPNPSIACRAAIFRARRGTVEVEFTNFLFRPALLKVCKTGGPGLTTPTGGFNFTVSTGGAGFPTSSTTVTGLLPGSCQFVQGPFTATNTTPIVGTFAFGQDVTITEGAVTGVNVTAFNVLSGSLTPVVAPAINPNLPGRTGTVRLSATTVAGGIAVNEVEFVNAASAAPVSTSFSISGRVMTPDGGGLRNAQVILVGANGQRISVPTSSMGYYSFENLGSQSYRVSVSSRRYRFDGRDVELNNSLSALDFTGIE